VSYGAIRFYTFVLDDLDRLAGEFFDPLQYLPRWWAKFHGFAIHIATIHTDRIPDALPVATQASQASQDRIPSLPFWADRAALIHKHD
jgi:hypothetical protein